MGNQQSRTSQRVLAYSRHTGPSMGSHTHYNGQEMGYGASAFIGRQRLSRQFSDNVFIHVPEITAPVLGRVLLRKCGNEGRHPYLDRAGQATLKFLRAAISFIPFASAAGADLSNASFIFSQPGREFVIKAGKGDWEFYFYQGYGGDIYGHCVRKPMLRYIWDGVTSAVRRVGTFLLPIMGPTLLALMAA